MKSYLIDKIVSIELKDKQPTNRFVWAESSCFLWKYKGYVYIYTDEIYDLEDFINGGVDDINYIEENKKIFYKPRVNINFVDGDKKIFEFNTYEEAKKYHDNLLNRFKPFKIL